LGISKARNLKVFLTPNEIQEIIDYVGEHRTSDSPFEVCISGILPAESIVKDKAIVQPYKEAGATWWIEFVYAATGSLEKNIQRIRFGPPH